MEINRRRSPSPQISRSKKLGGHKKEKEYANLIKGEIILGTKKGDVKDQEGKLHSVKSGKKWQLCLYSKKRIFVHPLDTIFFTTLSVEGFPYLIQKSTKTLSPYSLSNLALSFFV